MEYIYISRGVKYNFFQYKKKIFFRCIENTIFVCNYFVLAIEYSDFTLSHIIKSYKIIIIKKTILNK